MKSQSSVSAGVCLGYRGMPWFDVFSFLQQFFALAAATIHVT
jgi:hypothetical protein